MNASSPFYGLRRLAARVVWLALALAAPAAPAVSPPPAAPAGAASPADPLVTTLAFPCSGTTCAADLYLPQPAPKQPPPVVLMAHGFGGERGWGLPAYARRFAQAGMAVLVFDYRGFGASGGQPRYVVDAGEHLKDWLAALDYVRARRDLDASRVALWGTSYSGGQVLDLGQRKLDGVRAISAQVPFVSGMGSSWLYPFKHLPRATWLGLRDLMRGAGKEPVYVPTTDEHGGFAALICAECPTGYRKVVPPGVTPPNKVAARVLLTLPLYEPGRHADRIQVPVLVIAAARDGLIPVADVRQVAKRIPQAEYVELADADHFSPYTGPTWDGVVARQTAFLVRHLAPAAATAALR